MNAKAIFDYSVYIAARVVFSIIQSLSLAQCHSCAKFLSILLADVIRFRRRVVEDNLSIAFPDKTPSEKRRIARAMWEHLFLMICEIAHAPRKIHETNWREYFHLEGKAEMVAAMFRLQPKVVVTAHFGNFEIAGYIVGLLGIQTFTVARTLDNPYLDAYINKVRSRTGQFILPKVGSAPQADAVLANNGALVLLGDHHAGPRGCWVNFMGRPASCHKAVALFTLMSKAPMVVVYCRRLGKPLHFELGLAGFVDPEVPCAALAGVKQLTQWYNDLLEQEIRISPEQYWWLHRRWRDDMPAKEKQLAPAKAA